MQNIDARHLQNFINIINCFSGFEHQNCQYFVIGIAFIFGKSAQISVASFSAGGSFGLKLINTMNFHFSDRKSAFSVWLFQGFLGGFTSRLNFVEATIARKRLSNKFSAK